MESKKLICEQKSLKRISYNNRKECIKKKTMELATLCGIDACTIIYGADGKIESWPKNPAEAKAIINKFKDLMSNPYKRTTVRDESHKKVVVSCQDNLTQAKASVDNLRYLTDIPCQRTTKVLAEPDGNKLHSWLGNARSSNESSLYSIQSSVTGYQELLNQLDSKLEALTKRIEFLTRDQEYDMTCCCIENKQLDYSEKNTLTDITSPKRRKISQAPEVFPFDLNYPPPDEPERSSLSFEHCNVLPNR